ncbi:hypothetical protein PROFUN_02294 [Planoprotostelium fungivorum]|uniref:Uncharacterized protein n=1 Tax=Planoprotostelium fungivorum TaxID=1890364 RepID=A0A2P6NYI3_9EUKA|nr:hypothetical protein PROFUN_02294 [Planoprotostelium fungivorum]
MVNLLLRFSSPSATSSQSEPMISLLSSGLMICRYDPTIENSYRKQLNIDDETCMLDILDTAGQEEYAALRDQYIRSGQGFIIVYSITSAQSFQKLNGTYEQILRVKDVDSYPVVILGNKSDLEKDREVTTSDGKSFSDRISAPFFEASAKARINVEEPFKQLVREIRKYNPTANTHASPVRPPKKKSGGCTLLSLMLEEYLDEVMKVLLGSQPNVRRTGQVIFLSSATRDGVLTSQILPFRRRNLWWSAVTPGADPPSFSDDFALIDASFAVITATHFGSLPIMRVVLFLFALLAVAAAAGMRPHFPRHYQLSFAWINSTGGSESNGTFACNGVDSVMVTDTFSIYNTTSMAVYVRSDSITYEQTVFHNEMERTTCRTNDASVQNRWNPSLNTDILGYANRFSRSLRVPCESRSGVLGVTYELPLNQYDGKYYMCVARRGRVPLDIRTSKAAGVLMEFGDLSQDITLVIEKPHSC